MVQINTLEYGYGRLNELFNRPSHHYAWRGLNSDMQVQVGKLKQSQNVNCKCKAGNK